jgi:proteic killer suppression protein
MGLPNATCSCNDLAKQAVHRQIVPCCLVLVGSQRVLTRFTKNVNLYLCCNILGKSVDVKLSRLAKKQTQKAPAHIVTKLLSWVSLIRIKGLAHVQMIKGFHDEPLKGKKTGRRSVRLSRQWRAEYTMSVAGDVSVLTIEEVHPHEY